MKNVASVFTPEEQLFIKEYGGVVLDDDKDYSDDELVSIYDAVTEDAPYTDVFESIVDKFANKL